MKCINLIKCPKCTDNIQPELIVDEFGIVFELVCPVCSNSYGSVIERESSLEEPILTHETYKRVCESWQIGVCKELNLEYMECEYK